MRQALVPVVDLREREARFDLGVQVPGSLRPVERLLGERAPLPGVRRGEGHVREHVRDARGLSEALENVDLAPVRLETLGIPARHPEQHGPRLVPVLQEIVVVGRLQGFLPRVHPREPAERVLAAKGDLRFLIPHSGDRVRLTGPRGEIACSAELLLGLREPPAPRKEVRERGARHDLSPEVSRRVKCGDGAPEGRLGLWRARDGFPDSEDAEEPAARLALVPKRREPRPDRRRRARSPARFFEAPGGALFVAFPEQPLAVLERSAERRRRREQGTCRGHEESARQRRHSRLVTNEGEERAGEPGRDARTFQMTREPDGRSARRRSSTRNSGAARFSARAIGARFSRATRME